MTELDRKALEILNRLDSMFYIDMTDPLTMGFAHAESVKEDGVLLYISGIWEFNALTEERAVEIANEIVQKRNKDDAVCQHGKTGLEKVQKILRYDGLTPCYVAARFSKEPFEIKTDLEFRPLGPEHVDFVKNTYNFFKNDPDSRPYAEESIKRGMYGGFKDGKCVGFIGTHHEGTMGMLEILPEYRRRGYGRALEEYIANKFIEQGRYPYCHVIETNEASLALQKDMGYWISGEKRVYWFH